MPITLVLTAVTVVPAIILGACEVRDYRRFLKQNHDIKSDAKENAKKIAEEIADRLLLK